MARLALEGIRVVDPSVGWAGPMATALLADMGAEVIKIESPRFLDFWRGGGWHSADAKKPWESAPYFNSINRNKYELTLDLNYSQAKDVFRKLVKVSDVVVENFSPRVMKNFGLDYENLKKINPAIIILSMPAFGSSGPWKDFVAYGQTIEAMSGLPQLTGYLDGSPRMQSVAVGDPLSGVNGAFGVLAALRYRRKTGEGQHIELSQLEGIVSLIGDVVVGYSMNKRIPPRTGNRDSSMAPHGCYRCKGDDEWITIAVSSDEEWERFCEAIGSPPWTKEERFSGQLSRWRNQDELDRLVQEWTCQHEPNEAMRILQGAGVAAGAVLDGVGLLNDPHLKERGFFEVIDRAEVGTHPYVGVTAKLSKMPGSIRRPAPTLGEHNQYVLGEILGMPEEEISRLAEEQIIGTQPILE